VIENKTFAEYYRLNQIKKQHKIKMSTAREFLERTAAKADLSAREIRTRQKPLSPPDRGRPRTAFSTNLGNNTNRAKTKDLQKHHFRVSEIPIVYL